MLRKFLEFDPACTDFFGPGVVAESGITAKIKESAEAIADHVKELNTVYAAKFGKDLIKPTNKTVAGLRDIGKAIKTADAYGQFISNLYFVFWEGIGERLTDALPPSFKEINDLRTNEGHDLDHGKGAKAGTRRKEVAATFKKYGGSGTPTTVSPETLTLMQFNLLAAIEKDLVRLMDKFLD